MFLLQTKLVSLSVALTLIRPVYFLLLILVKDMKNGQMRIILSFGARQNILTIQQILLTTQTLLSGETVGQIVKLKVSTVQPTQLYVVELIDAKGIEVAQPIWP